MQIGVNSALGSLLKRISAIGASLNSPVLWLLPRRMPSNPLPRFDVMLVFDLAVCRLIFINCVRLESRRAGARHLLVATGPLTLYLALRGCR